MDSRHLTPGSASRRPPRRNPRPFRWGRSASQPLWNPDVTAAMMFDGMREKPRIILLLEMSENAHKTWLKISKQRGMTQVNMASRLVEWYAKQPHTIQTLILGHVPPTIREEVIQIALRKIGRT
jgi:hypothetical protein